MVPVLDWYTIPRQLLLEGPHSQTCLLPPCAVALSANSLLRRTPPSLKASMLPAVAGSALLVSVCAYLPSDDAPGRPAIARGRRLFNPHCAGGVMKCASDCSDCPSQDSRYPTAYDQCRNDYPKSTDVCLTFWNQGFMNAVALIMRQDISSYYQRPIPVHSPS